MFLGEHYPKLDDKGRLFLPARFREALQGGLVITKGQEHALYVFPRQEFLDAALSKECAVIGAGTRVEIWDAERWSTYREATEGAYAELSEEVLPGI